MANPSSPQLKQLVDDFVSQLTVLIHQSALDTVREALGEAPAKRRGPGRPRKGTRGPGRPRKAAKKASTTRGRRSADQVAAMGTTVLAHVRSNPGQRLEEIGRALGEPTKGLKRPIANLLAAGQLRTEGQKRGTRYYAGKGRKRKAAKKATKRRARKVLKRKAKKAGRPKATRKKKATKRKAGRKAGRAKPAAKKARRKLSPEQKAALVERLAKARAAKRGAA